MELTGKLIKIGTTTEKNVREFVIETGDKFPQQIKFTLFKDNCSKLDSFFTDDTVKVFFDIRGREWNGNHYNTLNCFKIESV
jgi:hypothetical protein